MDENGSSLCRDRIFYACCSHIAFMEPFTETQLGQTSQLTSTSVPKIMVDFRVFATKLARFQQAIPNFEDSFLNISSTHWHISRTTKLRYRIIEEEIKADWNKIESQGDGGDQVTILHAYFSVTGVCQKFTTAHHIMMSAELNSRRPKQWILFI